PLRRRTFFIVASAAFPALFVVVPLHRFNVILHVECLDQMFQDSWAHTLARFDRVFERTYRRKRTPEEYLLILDSLPLETERIGQADGYVLQNGSDLLKRKPEGFERDDLLNAFQIRIRVDAITCIRSTRFQQPEPVVVMQRLYCYTGQRCKFLNSISATQLRFSQKRLMPYVGTESSCGGWRAAPFQIPRSFLRAAGLNPSIA